MRIFFHAPGIALPRLDSPLSHVQSAHLAASSSLKELRASHKFSGNRGNLIHAEAPAKLFRHDPLKSVYGNIATLQRVMGDAYPEYMEEHFDIIIISMANFIREKHDGTHLVKALKALNGRVRFIVLGAGLQGTPVPDKMIPSNLDLISIFNEQADVFALRGAATKQWLDRYGYTNTVVLGCPSLYVYPDSILGLDYATARRHASEGRILTAGYLKPYEGRLYNRGQWLIEAFRGHNTSYIMQDEIFDYKDFKDQPHLFNEGTSQFDKTAIEEYLRPYGAKDLPFDRYYYFMETSGWRQAAAAHDVFIGDRLHGGVAALQGGIPAIFLINDNRVSEVAKVFKLPALSTREFLKLGLKRTLETYLSDEAAYEMKKNYTALHQHFRDFFAAHGLDVQPKPREVPLTPPPPRGGIRHTLGRIKRRLQRQMSLK